MPVKGSKPADATADREIILSRVFDAPRELVFDAWTDPKHVAQWWGPNGFTTTIQKMDVRPGGIWKLTMHGPDGTDYPNKSVYKEVVRPERIVYSHGGAKKGGPPATFEMTATFEAQGNKTKLTMRMLFPSAALRDQVIKEYGAVEGGKQTLARLAEYLPKMEADGDALVITRDFDAPCELVFNAWADPMQAKNWWGPKHHPATHVEMDVRPGGVWRNRLTAIQDGKNLWHGGVFREVVAPERLVFTFAWEEPGERGLETVVTLTFAEHNGKTRMTLRQTPFKSIGERDGHCEGWTSTFDRLEEFIPTVKPDQDDFVITRIFDAPRSLVFKAWTEPKYMAQWWGPQDFTSPVCEMDLRPGGAYRIVMRGPDGSEHPAKGIYREIVEPERLVMTINHSELSEEWHDTVNPKRDKSVGKPALEGVTTVTFDELGGRTKLTVRMRFESREVLHMLRNLGMNEGWSQSLERLQSLLTNIRTGD